MAIKYIYIGLTFLDFFHMKPDLLLWDWCVKSRKMKRDEKKSKTSAALPSQAESTIFVSYEGHLSGK